MSNKTMIFIDGGYVRDKLVNVHKRNWNWDISTFNGKLHNEFFYFTEPAQEEHIRTYYYDANYDIEDPNVQPKHQRKYETSKKIFEAFNRMEQVETVIEKLVVSGSGKPRQKGVDTRIAIDMIIKAQLGHYDIGILFCGDKDFIPIVKAIKTYTGKRVFGVYFSGHCPDELISLFDRTCELYNLHGWGFPS